MRSALIQCMGLIVLHLKTLVDGTSNAAPEEDEEVNVAQLTRVRDSMLDMLTERVHDCSGYTRAVVLKTWASLAEANAIPIERLLNVTDIGLDRLMDKIAAVRRAALLLLVTLLDYNPFAPSLQSEAFISMRSKLEEAYKIQKQQLMAQFEASESKVEEDAVEVTAEMKEEEFLASGQLQDDHEANELAQQLAHVTAALTFIDKITMALQK